MIFVIKKSDFLYFGVFSFRSEVTVLTTEITKLFRLHFSPSFDTKSEQNISELVQCKQRYSQIIFESFKRFMKVSISGVFDNILSSP